MIEPPGQWQDVDNTGRHRQPLSEKRVVSITMLASVWIPPSDSPAEETFAPGNGHSWRLKDGAIALGLHRADGIFDGDVIQTEGSLAIAH